MLTDLAADLPGAFDVRLLRTRIPKDVKFRDAANQNAPVGQAFPGSRAAPGGHRTGTAADRTGQRTQPRGRPTEAGFGQRQTAASAGAARQTARCRPDGGARQASAGSAGACGDPAIAVLVVAGALPWTALVAGVALPRLRPIWRAFGRPRPERPPPDFPVWPLWFAPLAFLHARRAGALFVIGLAAGALLTDERRLASVGEITSWPPLVWGHADRVPASLGHRDPLRRGRR